MLNSIVLPTRYVIQGKHFVFNEKFTITDESGVVQYTVDATLFSLGDKLLLYDADGNVLIKIRQDNLHLHPTYHIESIRTDADEMHLATIKRTGLPLQHKLEIDAVNGEYLMEKRGGVFSHDFVLTKDGAVVAVLTKDSTPTKSVYWMDVSNDREEYRAMIVSMVVVLSCVERLPGNFTSSANTDYEKF